jgi:hypothetical protein
MSGVNLDRIETDLLGPNCTCYKVSNQLAYFCTAEY